MTPSSNPHSAALQGLVAIVPAYNPGPLIEGVVQGLCAVGAETIVVDDGSTDGTVEPVSRFPVTVLRLDPNRGKGHALLAGFEKALASPATQAVAVLDADGQHDPNELPRLYDRFNESGADLLVGARNFDDPKVPFRSRFGNRLTVHLLRLLLGATLPDTQSGYRILGRPFAETILKRVPGGRYETEMAIVGMAVRGDYRIVSEPIQTIYIEGNRSSHFRKLRDSYRVYRTLLKAALMKRKSLGVEKSRATTE